MLLAGHWQKIKEKNYELAKLEANSRIINNFGLRGPISNFFFLNTSFQKMPFSKNSFETFQFFFGTQNQFLRFLQFFQPLNHPLRIALEQ